MSADRTNPANAMLLPPPPKVGTNRKAGTCSYCGFRVEAGAGDLFRGATGWIVSHKRLPEDCEKLGYVRVQNR